MPELPEVQTIVNQLKGKLVGRKIAAVEVRLPKMFQGERDKVVGKKIIGVERRAKIIIIHLQGGINLVTHLKMTGQLVYGQSGKAETISFSQGIPFAGFTLPAKTTHVVLDLDHGAKLFFNDMRQFGWMKVMTDKELAEVNEKHGPEPFDSLALASFGSAHDKQGKPTPSKEFTPEYLAKICSGWGRPIKLLLMEQSKIAGIGNIYANEALWCSQISPMKRARDLAKEEPEKVKKLYDCIKSTLETGLKYGGSSAADEAFVNAEGKPGRMQEHFSVYQKTGQPCPRKDGGVIKMARVGGRGTFFCPKCQG